jgi:hypothetical protein
MAKYYTVKEAPTDLQEHEYVLNTPNFLTEITLQKGKQGRTGLTGSNHLRMILDSIGQAYDPENMTAYSCRVSNFQGRPYSNDEELNKIVVEMLKADYPAVFPKYYDAAIKARPVGTTTIYYVDAGTPGVYEILQANGIERADTSTPKSGKVVGKPAITKAEAEALSKALQVDSAFNIEKGTVLK